MNEEYLIKIPVSENFKKILEQMSESQRTYALEQVLAVKERYIESGKQYSPAELAEVWINEMETYLAEVRVVPTVQCAKGCSFCCQINVDITEDEAVMIVKHCQTEGVEIDTKLMERQLGSDRETWRKLPKEDQRCAFLKDNLCSIYKARPMACRKYFSTTKKLCEDLEGGTVVLICNRSEIIASGIYAATESDSLPDMILKQLQKQLQWKQSTSTD